MFKVPDSRKCPYCGQDAGRTAMGSNWEPRWIKCFCCGCDIQSNCGNRRGDKGFAWVKKLPDAD